MAMKRQVWERTPYARSDAKDPDKQLGALLDKYHVEERQWTEHRGQHGRAACTLAFTLGGKTYRLTVEALDVERIERDPLVRQVKRVIFWTLKTLIENAVVFGEKDNEGLQKLLLPFLVDNEGHTVYERIQPFLKDVKAKALISVGEMLALPGPRTQKTGE